MRWAGVPVILMLLLIPATASAQGPEGKSFGLGISLGEPAGLSAKYWIDRRSTLDFALGFGYWPHHGFALYCDYLFNAITLMPAGRAPFSFLFYLGLGAKLGFWDHDADHDHYDAVGLGVRIPFGITMVFSRHPFDVFLEVAPVMAFIAPDPFWFDFDAAIGARFYF